MTSARFLFDGIVPDPRARWSSLSQAERDAAYDSNAAVSDSADLIQKRNAGSAAFRQTRSSGLDIPYGPLTRNRWDLYPAKDPKAPCLVFIHGGYWQRNSREDFAMYAQGLLAHGWSVAMPGYSLAPEVTLAEIVAEIHAALDWLKAEGPRHGLAGPVFLSGWSAGAQLTAMALAHPLVVAGFAISGVYDLEALRDIWVNKPLQLTDTDIETLSPNRLPVVRKPMTIAYGTAELPTLVNDSRQLHAIRAAAHVPGALVPIAGANHFNILSHLADPDGELTHAAINLMQYASGSAGRGRAA
jgi:arylformamidase